MSTPFPDNVLEVIQQRLVLVDGVTVVHSRNLAPPDENGAVGVWFEEWEPVDIEMGGSGGFTPAIGEYLIGIEHLVKHDDRAEGGAASREVARRIRAMLYRDPDTQVSLRQLVHTDTDGTVERIMKWSMRQSFGNLESDRAFVFVSATSFIVQTETIA